jgi:hypothetical protein
VYEADACVEDGDARDLVNPRGQDVADEHCPHVLGAVGRAIGQQHGRRRRHRVDDADDRLLGHVALPAAGECERDGAEQRASSAVAHDARESRSKPARNAAVAPMAAICAIAMSTKITSRALTWMPR